MKAIYKANERVQIEIEATSSGELLRKVVDLHEVFGGKACKNCGGTDLAWDYYTTKDEGHKYHQLVCVGCGWRFRLGVLNDGSFNLFPKHWEAPYVAGQSPPPDTSAPPASAPSGPVSEDDIPW